MTLAAEVTLELSRGATGAATIARRLGADEGLVSLVLRRLERDGSLTTTLLRPLGAGCATGCDADPGVAAVPRGCGGCPLAQGRAS